MTMMKKLQRRTSSSSRCKPQIHHKSGQQRQIQISAKTLSLKSLLFGILCKKDYTKNKNANFLKQNFAQPTFEDHLDKSMLPEVMQVKKFGKVSHTKYTHLVNQDTLREHRVRKSSRLAFFSTKIGGGMKQTFDPPATKFKKYN
ncbi:hypothetical protein MXB_1856 [Myxobolus squamalis]|nr:hypothetical protein MXB_1856 [Myxobolus squamalis]